MEYLSGNDQYSVTHCHDVILESNIIDINTSYFPIIKANEMHYLSTLFGKVEK
jgi:hypothetical protein